MSNSIEITGEVIRIKDKQVFDNFEKQEVILKTDEKYSQELPIEFFREDKIALIQGVRVGDSMTVHCNLQGREWKGNDKWFLGLSAWRVDNAGSNESRQDEHNEHNEAKSDGYAPQPAALSDEVDGGRTADDDIPFAPIPTIHGAEI